MPDPAPANPGNWFAAIPVELPGPFLEALRAGAPPLRWFAPEDIHLTVAFFGRYQSECLEAVRDALRALPAFEIRASLGPLVPLPSPRRFSAVSFELRQGSAEAAEIMRRFHAPLMAAAGLPPETRPAYPHITVARPDRRASAAECYGILEWMRGVPVPAVQVTLREVALYRWADDRRSRQFQRLVTRDGGERL
jgi:2'-5' RNA ligase